MPVIFSQIDEGELHSLTRTDIPYWSTTSNPEECLVRLEEITLRLEDALKSLHPREEAILRARFAEDMSPQDIGKSLGISNGRVHQLIQRSLRKVKRDNYSTASIWGKNTSKRPEFTLDAYLHLIEHHPQYRLKKNPNHLKSHVNLSCLPSSIGDIHFIDGYYLIGSNKRYEAPLQSKSGIALLYLLTHVSTDIPDASVAHAAELRYAGSTVKKLWRQFQQHSNTYTFQIFSVKDAGRFSRLEGPSLPYAFERYVHAPKF